MAAKAKSELAPMKSLRDKAMLVKFQDSVWGGVRRDNVVRKKVSETYETKKEKVGYYNKFLVPKDTLEARVQKGLEARRFHNANTLPWLDDGVRVLPAANFQDYIAGMRKREREAREEEQVIYRNWEAIKRDGMLLLGKMAREEDYPSLDELKAKFAFNIIILPLPETADWRIDVPKKELADLQRGAQQALAQVQADFVKEMWTRLGEVVEHCHERLKEEDTTFRNSLFENIKKMVALLPKLNVVSDPQLEAVRKEVEAKLAKQTPDEVRADPGLRKKVAKDAAEIMRKMKSYMG
jgi:hypothetical protein